MEHDDDTATPMTDALAASILTDHAYGLHEGHDNGPWMCGWPRCDEAYWHEAIRNEAQP